MSKEYMLTCPKCGYEFEMDDPDDWECPNCGNVGTIHWNGDEISFLEVFHSPICCHFIVSQ